MKKNPVMFAIASLGLLLTVSGCSIAKHTKPLPQQQQTQTEQSFWTPGHRFRSGNQLFYFINVQYGWKLVSLGAACGSEGVDLFATTDGGKKWTQVASANLNNPGGGSGPAPDNPPPGTIPFVGDKKGITFLNRSTGWITGVTGGDGVAWLYTTNDGGHTWQRQALTIPPQYKSSQLSATPPTFFSAEDGILPVIFSGYNTASYYLYFTDNGGNTWGTPERLIGQHSFGPWQWLFNSDKSGIITINQVTWQTDDGGYTWNVYSRTGGRIKRILGGGSGTRQEQRGAGEDDATQQ